MAGLDPGKGKIMKRNLFMALLCLLVALVIISCDEPKHEHAYGTEWKHDETNHWLECSCGEKSKVAAHTYGEWKASSKEGKVERKCTVCEYVETADGVVVTTAEGFKAAVASENKIKLAADIELEDYINISKSIELDGNGHTLTMACKSQDYGASGLHITGDDVKSVLVKDITLKAKGKYPSQTALVYINSSVADVSLENVVMECNPDGTLTNSTAPIGIQSIYREKGSISVKGCTIKGAKYGMYFNSISDGVIEDNTIDGTFYSGIILAGDHGSERKYDSKNVAIKNNVLKNVASENYEILMYNCGIYIGEHTSNITVEGNDVTLAATSTNGKAIVYYKDTTQSKDEV